MGSNGMNQREKGTALVTVLLLMMLMMALLGGYYTLTAIEMSSTRSSMNSTRGFYAAEAGLNLRAESIRQNFLGYNRPSGTSPDNVAQEPCTSGNMGSGDFQCVDYELQQRPVSTYVKEPAGNPTSIVVPKGEAYQDLSAQEYRYEVYSQAVNADGKLEALLEMQVKSRLVPMFQFAAFYNKDLEILPGPAMTLAGPVHSNGDLYLGANSGLTINGQITAAGDLYRGRKNSNTCSSGAVLVPNPGVLADLPACSGGRRLITENDVVPWNGMVRLHLDPVTVPGPEALAPAPGNIYWDKAEIRVMLNMNNNPATIEVYNPDGSMDSAAGAALAGCGAAAHNTGFFNNREGAAIDMLDVDMTGLLDCAYTQNLLVNGRQLDDTSEGGLVFYLGVLGPDQDTVNNYGVRVRNGAEIRAASVLAPAVQGLTVVTDQAIYIQGDYNSVNKVPAAFLADSLNVLSNAWNDANSTRSLNNRVASDTTINAAFLAGTDLTGGSDGAAGQDGGAYNGGLENYPRFHEKWTGRTLYYAGSFVSLNTPLHVDGAWAYGGMQYKAPRRAWNYDTDFNDASKLPPLTPRFVYLKQELFVRRFEL